MDKTKLCNIWLINENSNHAFSKSSKLLPKLEKPGGVQLSNMKLIKLLEFLQDEAKDALSIYLHLSDHDKNIAVSLYDTLSELTKLGIVRVEVVGELVSDIIVWLTEKGRELIDEWQVSRLPQDTSEGDL